MPQNGEIQYLNRVLWDGMVFDISIELDDGKIYRETPTFDGKNQGFL